MYPVNIHLGIIQMFHFLIDAFNMSYIFIFNPFYDVYFCTWILLQTMHWGLLKNECIVSYVEKIIIDPTYKLGTNPRWIPHNNVYHNKYTLISKAIIIIGTLLLIMYRAKKGLYPFNLCCCNYNVVILHVLLQKKLIKKIEW